MERKTDTASPVDPDRNIADIPLWDQHSPISSPACRYTTLDALRGVAALLVAVFHLGQNVGYRVPEGYLAVDMFFALSGFVIALNYTQRLRLDMSWRAFMAKRLIRLYPLYFLGTALGGARRIEQLFRAGGHDFTPAGTLVAGLLGLLLLPTPPGVGTTALLSLFPLNDPSWSLFLELAVNIIFAIMLFRLAPPWLIGICLLSAMYLIVRVQAPAWLNVGRAWPDFDQGMARTLYSFPLGMLLWRWKPAHPGKERWIALAAIAVMGGLLLADVPDQFRKLFDLVTVLGIFPVLLFISIRFELPRLTNRLFGFLGDISYAIYAIHWPFIVPFVMIARKLRLSALASTFVFVIALVAISAFAHYVFDIPVRRWISKRQRAAAAAIVL